MHFSLFLGQGVKGPADDAEVIDLGIEQAHIADEAGFAAVYSGEQHFNNYEPYANGFMMNAYLAGQLKQAYLGLSVVPLVIQHPLLFVENANLLDQLTKGRCIVGISSGRPREGKVWHKHDLAPDVRTSLFDAKFDVVERAWAHDPNDGPLEFDTGDEHGVMDGRIMPASFRANHPLYAIATNTPSKIVEAGRRGQLVHLGPFGLSGVADMVSLYRSSLQEGGHDQAAIDWAMGWLIHTKMVMVADTVDEAWANMAHLFEGPMSVPPWIKNDPADAGKSLREIAESDPGDFAPAMGMPESMSAYLRRMAIVGDPDSVAAQIKEYDAVGANHLHARFAFGKADLGVYRRSLDLFTTEVMPQVGATRIAPPSADEIRPEYRG